MTSNDGEDMHVQEHHDQKRYPQQSQHHAQIGCADHIKQNAAVQRKVLPDSHHG